MPDIITYVGATIAVVAAVPATYNSAGYAALTWVPVGKITSWGEAGDTSEDVAETTLAGRVIHANGALDGGAVAFAIVVSGTDAGQTILVNNSNSNTDISYRVTDPDGKIEYSTGIVANVRSRERTASTAKGLTGEARINTALVRV
jgi:hypothetical protein